MRTADYPSGVFPKARKVARDVEVNDRFIAAGLTYLVRTMDDHGGAVTFEATEVGGSGAIALQRDPESPFETVTPPRCGWVDAEIHCRKVGDHRWNPAVLLCRGHFEQASHLALQMPSGLVLHEASGVYLVGRAVEEVEGL